MPQDEHMKHVHEQEQAEHKAEREQAEIDRAINDAALQANSHTGQQGMLPTDAEPVEGDDIKSLREMLPGFTKDELRRIRVVPRGTRLSAGDKFCDLRFREIGELVAHGEEEIHDELLVAKNDVDYEIWNKLLGRPNLAG